MKHAKVSGRFFSRGMVAVSCLACLAVFFLPCCSGERSDPTAPVGTIPPGYIGTSVPTVAVTSTPVSTVTPVYTSTSVPTVSVTFTPVVTLTPSGCTSFLENFDDGNAQDGSPIYWDNPSGLWYVSSGVYRIDNSPSVTSTTYDFGGDIADFTLDYDVNMLAGSDRLIYLRQQDSSNYYEFNFRRQPHTSLILTKMVSGSQTIIWQTVGGEYLNDLNHWYHISLSVIGNQFDIHVDDGAVSVYTHTAYDSEFASGGIALVGHYGTVLYDNIDLQCQVP